MYIAVISDYIDFLIPSSPINFFFQFSLKRSIRKNDYLALQGQLPVTINNLEFDSLHFSNFVSFKISDEVSFTI